MGKARPVWLRPLRFGPDVASFATDGREVLLVCRTDPERVVLLILDPLGLQLPPPPSPQPRTSAV